MFNRPSTIIGSGIFVCEQLLSRPVTIISPYIKTHALEKIDEASGGETAAFVNRTRESSSVFSVYQDTLHTYAEKLVEISRLIKESAFDIVLCPMRGGRMPGIQAELVCETEPFRPFDGADMGQRANESRIIAELRRLLHEAPANSEVRRIGILDTADGGDSCRELARLLRQLNDMGNECWAATFHLIHANRRVPPRTSQAYGFSTKHFAIDIRYHGVDDLLIEDEARLLGYQVQRSAGQSHILPYQQEGQILVHGPDGATLYRRAPLDELMLALVSQEMMKLIVTMPDIKPMTLDYWPYGR